jgi:hypothetical protein
VFDLSIRVISNLVAFYPSFRRCVDASAKSLEMKAPFNINLPTLANVVMVNPRNPVNPDSKPHAAYHSSKNKRAHY